MQSVFNRSWVWHILRIGSNFAPGFFTFPVAIDMIQTSAIYTASDRIRDIIEDNGLLLLVLSRFKIPFGFGNGTIQTVCADKNIDCSTFLAVANLVSNRNFSGFPVHLPTLVGYLKEAHSYILDFSLPCIKATLVQGVQHPQLTDVALYIIKFFDDYMEEVRKHMTFENEVMFPYIDQLENGLYSSDFRIKDFATKHNSMAAKLTELKDLFLQHYPIPNTRVLNQALFSIMACDEDLISHCEIENSLLVPAVEALEKCTSYLMQKQTKEKDVIPSPSNEKTGTLSEREKEIIRLVAQGLSNKEIADRLCLSFHTITTYRKNLSTKLNLHSTAALVIYAILHNIVDPKDIELK